MPDEQREPTRVELRAAYEAGFEASGEGWNGEYLGPKVEYPACLDKGFAEWLSEQPASAPSEQREGEARGDLAERLEAAAKATVGRHSDLLREAASTLDHQTKALEAADKLARFAAGVSPRLTKLARAYRSTRTTKGGRDDG